MTHEFEYMVIWYYDDEEECDREIYVTQVDDDGSLGEYEVEEIARNNAYLFAESEYPELDYEVTLIDAR
jgi:hypothetical protein